MPDTFAQGRVKTFMRHTYTWRQRLDPTQPLPPNVVGPNEHAVPLSVALTSTRDEEDDVNEAWGVIEPLYGPPIAGIPCIFHDGGTQLDAATGTTIRLAPSLRVAWDDPLDGDDLVLDVIDGNGISLTDGPLRVMFLTNHAPHGMLLWKDAPLLTAEVED